MKVAVIDSGIRAIPETGPLAGGISFVDENWNDLLGHGTWVAATIRHYAPQAELYAVKVFSRELRTQAETLARAIRWAARSGMDLACLALGTSNPAHRELLEVAVKDAGGMIIVAPFDYLPGSIPPVIGVREGEESGDGILRAPGTAIPLAGLPSQPSGVSFATARIAGRIAAGLLTLPERRASAGTSSSDTSL
jgi:subtilisin family serine protease